jgi:uncharacterized membrane protein YkoI
MKMKRMTWLVPALVAATAVWAGTLAAQDTDRDEGNQAGLAKAVMGARISLERGLVASATRGRPISAKFEMEDGRLQLSIYTAKDGKFSEVVVDHSSGKVVKAEPITEGEDLSAATEQNTAMAKAKVSLAAAVGKALRRNTGYRAVSVTPSLKDGRPIADITLLKGEETKTESVPLQE